jgi:hypothetical protein
MQKKKRRRSGNPTMEGGMGDSKEGRRIRGAKSLKRVKRMQ